MGAEVEGNPPPPLAAGEPTAAARAQPITAAQFLSWKQRKDAEEAARKAEAAQKRAVDIASGVVQMNGESCSSKNPGCLTIISTKLIEASSDPRVRVFFHVETNKGVGPSPLSFTQFVKHYVCCW
ncbi:hypothetical protein ACP70R_048639 [Stipagrostis hirtigluma subsp. patula]